MNTYGFDYAFALSVDAVNAILKRNLAGVVMNVHYTTKDEDTGSTITLTGKLAPWQLVRGGQNTLLNVNIPFSEGSLTLTGGALKGNYDLSGVTVEMQISLGWMGAGDAQSSGSGSATQLVFDPTNTKDKNNPGYVAALQIFDDKKHLDTLSKGLLKSYMADALVSNRDAVRYVFANVNPARANVDSWLKPQKWLYFYTETGSDAALCFLGMLTNAAFPQAAFDSSTLSASTNAIVLISQQAFFSNVLLPAIKSSLPGGSFGVSCTNDVCAIRSSGSFSVGNLAANAFNLAADGHGLASSSSGGGPLKFLFGLVDLPDATYAWDLHTKNALQFSNGSITFAIDANPETHQSQDIKWYDWVLLVVTGITSLPGLIGFIVALIDGFSNQVQQVGMSAINQKLQAAAGGAVVNLSKLIQWNKQGESFAVTAAGL